MKSTLAAQELTTSRKACVSSAKAVDSLIKRDRLLQSDYKRMNATKSIS